MSASSAAEEEIRQRLAEVEAARSEGPDGSRWALAAQHRLAHAYRAARRFDEAIVWFADTVDKSAMVHGADHPETLRYRSSLANCHYAAGDTDRAIGMFRELYEARLSALGAEHPDTMRSRGSLANALHSAGQRQDAEELHRRNAGAREAVLGIDHPATQASVRNLDRAMGHWDDDGDDGRDGCPDAELHP